jgi:hypothetical protein
MRTNPWLFAGVFAPLVYAAAVILGGRLTPGYSHLAHPISALSMAGAPAAAVLDPIFTVYNALMVVFAFALGRAFRGRGLVLGLGAPVLVALIGLTGILMNVYPMDPIGTPLTDAGRVHIWLAAIASVASMLAVLVVALPLRRDPQWRRFGGYALISMIVILASGAFAALAAARASPVMGLWERVTIGAFLQWVLVLALLLLARGGTAR